MKDLLQRPVAFHPALARLFGGVNEAIYWQQLHYWSDKGGRSDGFIYKTKDDIEAETTLTRKQQDRVRKVLEDLGYLETKLHRANGHPTVHYKVNIPLVQKGLMEKTQRDYSEKPERDQSLTESTQRLTPGETSSPKYEIVPDVEVKEKKVKSTEALQVFSVFGEVTGRSPLNWRTNKTQRISAENLFKERGIVQIRKALEFHSESKDLPFCPAIHSPYDLDSKWTKLYDFIKKQE